MIPSYPKIFALGSEPIKDVFNGQIIEITEKIDGSQFAFGVIDGELQARSKGQQLIIDHPNKMFELAVVQIKLLHVKGFLQDNFVYYCEYLNKPKHNALTYGRVPFNNLALFAVYNPLLKDYDEQIEYHANQLGIDVVHRLFYDTYEAFLELGIDALLALESELGKAKIEGFVIKCYGKAVDFKGIIFPIATAKYVSEAFKEVHRGDWAKNHTSRGGLESFISSFRAEARWAKAVQHLKEDGTLLNELKDIGALCKSIQKDIVEEEKENIKEHLYSLFKDQILRKSIAGLPEWYKRLLAGEAL